MLTYVPFLYEKSDHDYTCSLLVAPLRILLVVLGNADHVGNSDGVQVTESLNDLRVSIPKSCCNRKIKLSGQTSSNGGMRTSKANDSTHLPPPGVPRKAPGPPCPALDIVYPPPGTKQLLDTHILERAVRELTIPLVLHLCDLASRLVVEDQDLAVDDLLLAETLDNIAGLEVHADGVAAISDFVVETLNFREGRLQSIL